MGKALRFVLMLVIVILSLRVSFAQAGGIDVDFLKSTDLVDPCGLVSFDLRVTNLDPEFQDRYVFSLDAFSLFSAISKDSLILEPRSSGNLTVSFRFPCDRFGAFEANLLARNEVTGEVFATPLAFEVRPRGIPLITTDADTILIGENKSQVSITVENLGSEDTTYLISVEGEGFITASIKEVSIPGREKKMFRLIFTPPKDLALGDYPITLVLKVGDTGVEYAKELLVRYRKPSAFESFVKRNVGALIGSIFVIGAVVLFTLRFQRTREERMERRAQRQAMRDESRRLRDAERTRKAEERVRTIEASKNAALFVKEEKARVRLESRKASWRKAIRPFLLAELYDENLIIPRKKPSSVAKRVFLIVLALISAGAFLIRDVLPEYVWFIIGGVLAAFVCIGLHIVFKWRKGKSLRHRLMDEIDTIKSELRKELVKDSVIVKKVDVANLKKPRPISRWVVMFIVILLLAVLAWSAWFFRDLIGGGWLGALIACALLAVLIIWDVVRRLRDDVMLFIGDVSANRLIGKETGWISGIREISLKLESTVEGVVLALYLHRRQPTFTDPAGVPLSFVEIKSNVRNRDIERVLLTIAVSKRLLRRKKADHSDLSIQRYLNGKWRPLATESAGEDDHFLFYKAECDGFGFIALTADVKTESKGAVIAKVDSISSRTTKKPVVKQEKVEALFDKGRSRQRGKKILFIFGILLLIIGLTGIGYFLYQRQTAQPQESTTAGEGLGAVVEDTSRVTDEIAGIADASGGIPPQTINGSVSIDLGQFFADPDNESLAFTNSPSENLIISYDVAQVTVRAKEGFSGEEVVIFTATDSSNNSVSSNPVRFIVSGIARSESGGVSQSVLISVSFFIVLLALIITTIFVRKSRKELDEEE
ncbi:PGF-pre-PGF domain-containing protein [Candidatus Woesearchaeota archaeon]|nr:PGF-pre-PGF domain-containing protein [Candidatus Woesearchaeota archaeon]